MQLMQDGIESSGSPSQDASDHVKPYVHDSPGSKALHFSISELQSRMRLHDPCALDLAYTRVMMGFLLFKPDPRQIAMIGLGGGSLLKFCHRYLPSARIEVVEINPHVIALRDEFQVPADDQRLSVLRGDGAQYVRHCQTPPDVLMVDGFDSEGLPPKLSSQRFYDDCHALLQPGGILVANLHREHARYDIQLDRIRRSFDDVVLVVGDGEQSNSIVLGGKGRGYARLRPSAVRAPGSLDGTAARQLQGAFERVRLALHGQGGFEAGVRQSREVADGLVFPSTASTGEVS